MHILIDIALILVFVLTVIHYYRIGFIKALFSVCKLFLAIAVAFALAAPIGGLISDNLVYTPTYNAVKSTVDNLADKVNDSADMSTLVDELPESIMIFVDSSGHSTETLKQELSGEIINDNTVSKLSASIAGKISGAISNIIAFLVIFVIAFILLTVVVFVLDKIFNALPVLKETNKILGVAFGVLAGIFNAFATCTVITLLLHLFGVDSPNLSAEVMAEKTVIYSLISNIDLSGLILNVFSSK